MKKFLRPLYLLPLLLLGGCGFLDAVAPVGPDGAPVKGVGDQAVDLISSWGPAGAGVGLVLAGGLALYRYFRRKKPPAA